MKTTTKALLAAILVAPLLAFGTVSADEDMDTPASDKPTTTSAEVRKTGNEGLTLQQRLDKYKAAVKTRLTAVQKTRVQARCKASQGNVSTLKGRITLLKQKRHESYDHLMTHLHELNTKLKEHELNTVEYEKQLAELQTKVDTFQTDLAKYEEAATDLAAMNCMADPDGFKASLETARTLRAAVVQDGKAIHDYLSSTIKPTIQAFRSQLHAASSEREG